MAKTKKAQAEEFIKSLQDTGHLIMIGPAGEARVSPPLPADGYARLTDLNKQLVAILRGEK